MACSRGYYALLVVLKLRVYNHIRGVDYYLAHIEGLHVVFEEEFLLEIYFGFDLIVFHLIVYDTIFDVLFLEVKHETATLALLLGFHHDLATFMKGATWNVQSILFISFLQSFNLDLFIKSNDFVLHLRNHCKVKLFIGAGSEVSVI